MSSVARRSLSVRIVAALVVLWLIDLGIPGWLASLERRRYEPAGVFRFPPSDLFGIGPAVEYLQEHPIGDRPRAMFFGTSVVWGYGVPVEESLPSVFARLEPSARVMNFAVNGFGGGSAYLLLKQVIGSVDTAYVLASGSQFNHDITRLIPVADDDIERFGLAEPDRLELRAQRALGFWRLYRYSYRIQAAAFGTSTRNQLYRNKGALFSEAGSAPPGASLPASDATRASAPVSLVHAKAGGNPDARRRQDLSNEEPLLWDYGTLARERRRKIVLYRIVPPEGIVDERFVSDFNRVFQGAAVFGVIRVPAILMLDAEHLTVAGSRVVAATLQQLAHAGFADAVH